MWFICLQKRLCFVVWYKFSNQLQWKFIIYSNCMLGFHQYILVKFFWRAIFCAVSRRTSSSSPVLARLFWSVSNAFPSSIDFICFSRFSFDVTSWNIEFDFLWQFILRLFYLNVLGDRNAILRENPLSNNFRTEYFKGNGFCGFCMNFKIVPKPIQNETVVSLLHQYGATILFPTISDSGI